MYICEKKIKCTLSFGMWSTTWNVSHYWALPVLCSNFRKIVYLKSHYDCLLGDQHSDQNGRKLYTWRNIWVFFRWIICKWVQKLSWNISGINFWVRKLSEKQTKMRSVLQCSLYNGGYKPRNTFTISLLRVLDIYSMMFLRNSNLLSDGSYYVMKY